MASLRKADTRFFSFRHIQLVAQNEQVVGTFPFTGVSFWAPGIVIQNGSRFNPKWLNMKPPRVAQVFADLSTRLPFIWEDFDV